MVGRINLTYEQESSNERPKVPAHPTPALRLPLRRPVSPRQNPSRLVGPSNPLVHFPKDRSVPPTS